MKRSTRTFLVLFSLLLALAASLVLVAFVGRGPAPGGGGAVLALDLRGSFPEQDSDAALAALLGERALTLAQLVGSLDQAKDDTGIAALELRVGFLDLGWARAKEIRDAVVRFAASGKPVHAFLEEGGDDGTYYVASAAERVQAMPSGTLWLDGINAEVTFYAGTLDKVGVRADLEQIGEYKNAADVMERTGMSEAHREAMNSLVDGLFAELVTDLAASLEKPPSEVETLISGGPYTPQQALDAGLLDAIGYEDEAGAALDEVLGRADVPRIDLADYAEGLDAPSGRKSVGVVYCVGSIMPGESSNGPLSGQVMGSDTIAEAIRGAVEDDEVDALVLRVDSPGGSPVASDVIWRSVRRAQDAGIPVVVSMADVAASGGYWISMGADEVVAQPSTITGSIGIFGGKYVLAGLNDKIAMTTEPVSRGANADINSTLREFTPEQRDWLRGELASVYGQFLQKTADGRGFESVDEVDAIARGRVWTGRQAQERGLVDALGGLDVAVASACRLARLDEHRVRVRTYPRTPGLLETLVGSGVRAPLGAVRHALAADVARELPVQAEVLHVARLLRQLQREGVLAYLPYRVRAR